jgi:hypothetical protein
MNSHGARISHMLEGDCANGRSCPPFGLTAPSQGRFMTAHKFLPGPAGHRAALVAGLALVCTWACAAASEPDATQSSDPTAAFFAAHCRTCHTGKEPKGDFDIESLTVEFLDKANRDR